MPILTQVLVLVLCIQAYLGAEPEPNAGDIADASAKGEATEGASNGDDGGAFTVGNCSLRVVSLAISLFPIALEMWTSLVEGCSLPEATSGSLFGCILTTVWRYRAQSV